MIKIPSLIAVSVISSLLTGCVSQSYENNAENPVIENNSTNSEMASTRVSLAMGYLKMGNTTQAKINLEKAKRFAPGLTQVYTAYAHYFDAVDEPKQAIVAYEKALSLDPEDADALNNYGVFLCKQELYAESEKQMLRAIAVPSYALVSKSYENLALCQLEAKQFDKAEMYFAKSIAHSPSNSSSLIQMLRLQYIMGNYDEAQVYLRRYEKTTRRFSSNALALAYKVFDKVNNKRVAKNYAGMLVKMFPNSYEANQYIINELSHIEADTLAKEYRLIIGENKRKSKKRVMVLSPNKRTGISLKSEVKAEPVVELTSITEPTTVAELAKQDIPEINETTLIDNPVTSDVDKVAIDNVANMQDVQEINETDEPDIELAQYAVEINKIDITQQVETTEEFKNTDETQITDQALTEIESETTPELAAVEESVSGSVDTLSKSEEVDLPEVENSGVEENTVSTQEKDNENAQRTLTLPIHVVVKGDSLFSISQRYNIKMYYIERWNGFKRTKILKIGDVIYLANPKKALKS